MYDTIAHVRVIISSGGHFSTVATVSLQPVSATEEGNDASVTVELSPPGQGTAISITVTLGSINGDASKCMSIDQLVNLCAQMPVLCSVSPA